MEGRSSGILLPISALPGPCGGGTLGQYARRFIDFALSEDVQRYLMDHCSRRSVRADLRQEEEGRFLAFDSFDYDAVWAGEQRETLLAQWRALCGEEGGGI